MDCLHISRQIQGVAVREGTNKDSSLTFMQRHYPKLKRILTRSSAVLLFSLIVLGAIIAPPQRTAYAFFSDTETVDITFSTNNEVASSYLKNLLGWAEFVKNKIAIAQAFAAGVIDLKINGTDDTQVVNFSGMSPGVWGDYAFTLSITPDQQIYYVLKPVYQEGSMDLFNTLSMELYNGSDHLLTAPLQDLSSWCGLFQPESSDSFTIRIQKRANQNFTNINGSVRFHLTITAVQATNNPDFCSSTNNPPTLFDLTQFDGATSIGEGGIIRNASVGLFAYINDPENNQVKLQVELRQLNEPFTGNDDGGILTSDLVASGSGVKVNRAGLSDGAYHWRARAVDEHGNKSAWQEFGSVGNTDFEIRTNEPPVASFTFQPSNPKVGDTITFDASSSYDLDGTIVLYSWDWNTDGIMDAYSDTPSIQYNDFSSGISTATLYVTDNKGAVGSTSADVSVESTNQSTASILDAFCSAFGGWWCGSEVYQNEKDLKTIDEWLRDKNGDGAADSDTTPFDWTKGTKCSGTGTNLNQEKCLISALDTEFAKGSGLTYKAYILSVITEQKMVEKAFKQQHLDTYKLYMTLLVDWLPFKNVIDIFYNDITTSGMKGFLANAAPSLPYATVDIFTYGTSFLSFGMEAKKINETFNKLNDGLYNEALVVYLSMRGTGHDPELAWKSCNPDGTCGGPGVILAALLSEDLLPETKNKFDEWYNKYQPHFIGAGGFDNQFKLGLKKDMEMLTRYAIKNAPK